MIFVHVCNGRVTCWETHEQTQFRSSRCIMHSGSVLESSNFTCKVRIQYINHVTCKMCIHVHSLSLHALPPMNPATYTLCIVVYIHAFSPQYMWSTRVKTTDSDSHHGVLIVTVLHIRSYCQCLLYVCKWKICSTCSEYVLYFGMVIKCVAMFSVLAVVAFESRKLPTVAWIRVKVCSNYS